MITAIIASVTPFVAAQPVDTAVAMPEAPVATYNWSDQNAKAIISDEDVRVGTSFSYTGIPGSKTFPQRMDDANLA